MKCPYCKRLIVCLDDSNGVCQDDGKNCPFDITEIDQCVNVRYRKKP